MTRDLAAKRVSRELGPMFAAFDRGINGELCHTMVHTLIGGSIGQHDSPINSKNRLHKSFEIVEERRLV